MRHITFILSILFYLITGTAGAMDVLIGTVRLVDSETGEIVLEVAKCCGNNMSDIDKSEPLTIQIEPDRLPKCVVVGKMIRVWGDYIKGETRIFKAQHISGGGYYRGHGTDPTGVRSRLGKGRGMFKRGSMGKGRRGH